MKTPKKAYDCVTQTHGLGFEPFLAHKLIIHNPVQKIVLVQRVGIERRHRSRIHLHQMRQFGPRWSHVQRPMQGHVITTRPESERVVICRSIRNESLGGQILVGGRQERPLGSLHGREHQAARGYERVVAVVFYQAPVQARPVSVRVLIRRPCLGVARILSLRPLNRLSWRQHFFLLNKLTKTL
jgi:hypothetical protein